MPARPPARRPDRSTRGAAGSATPGQSGRAPASLRRAAALVAVEGAALSVVAVGFGAAGVLGDPDDRSFTLLEAAMALLVGLALMLVARGVVRGRRWARSSAVTSQLLALPVGVGLAQNAVWLLAAVVLGLAGAVLVLLAAPDARAVFEPEA